MENGMASPTRVALRTPRANRSTSTTSNRPDNMLFSRSASISRMPLALFMSLVISTPAGQPGLCSSISRSTASTMSMIFSPARFLTAILTASRPSKRDRDSSSLNPSTTRAISFK